MSTEKDTKAGVDLSLAKRLLNELDDILVAANEIKQSKGDIQQYMIEAAKATGLALGLMREASMLVGDIAMMIQSDTSTSSTTSPKKNTLEDLLGGILSKNALSDKSKN